MKREFSSGGLVIRRFRGRPFVAAIRPKEGVLALPKGHPDEGESMKDAAVREVREETGLEAKLDEKLGDIKYFYVDRGGQRVFKLVSFFLLRYRSGSIKDHDFEVESVEWVPLAEAPKKLSYKGEREMAEAALSRLKSDR